MRLRSFQVKKFRNIVDSGEVEVEEQVTCLVGKNEAGKSALLEALYLFNPPTTKRSTPGSSIRGGSPWRTDEAVTSTT